MRNSRKKKREKEIGIHRYKMYVTHKKLCRGSPTVKFVLEKVALSLRSSHVTHHQGFTPRDLIRINDEARRKEDRAEERKSKLKQERR